MTESPVDEAVLRELEEATGADFVAELVATFLEEAPAMIADLSTAAGAGDGEAFRRAAHSLKSNASTFGATTLSDQARALELGGLPEDADARDDAISAVKAGYDLAAAHLRDLTDG